MAFGAGCVERSVIGQDRMHPGRAQERGPDDEGVRTVVMCQYRLLPLASFDAFLDC